MSLVGYGLFVALSFLPGPKEELEVSDRLSPEPQPAGSRSLFLEDEAPYVRARWHLRSGRPAQALRVLAGADLVLLADRATLVRGQAHEAEGELDAAKEAYRAALDRSTHPTVSEAAVRGLFSIAKKQRDRRAELLYLDALIAKLPRVEPRLELQKVELLIELSNIEAAKREIWAILDSVPSLGVAERAQKLLARVDRKALRKRETRARVEIGRARYFFRSGRQPLARAALGRARSLAPKLAQAIDLESSESSESSALWLAGWKAYLARSSSVAAEAFGRLLERDVDPELREGATYWLARTHEQTGRTDEAIAQLQALATRAPLRYYGFLAQSRLEALGWAGPREARQELEPPVTIEELAARLGPRRPLNLDRAVALFRARLRAEMIEELLFAADVYRRQGDAHGMAMIVAAFRLFDRNAWSSLLARNIAEEQSEQPVGDPALWSLWREAYPTPFRIEVDRASRDHRVDPNLTYAVMRTESRYRPDAISPAGARGLMQLMPKTARFIARSTPRARPKAARFRAPGPNIWLGARYLRMLLERYQGRLVEVLGAYNAGPGAMDRWLKRFHALEPDELAERIPIRETRRYIRRTLETWMVYRTLYRSEATRFADRS